MNFTQKKKKKIHFPFLFGNSYIKALINGSFLFIIIHSSRFHTFFPTIKSQETFYRSATQLFALSRSSHSLSLSIILSPVTSIVFSGARKNQIHSQNQNFERGWDLELEVSSKFFWGTSTFLLGNNVQISSLLPQVPSFW